MDKQKLARALLGGGMAGQAADLQSLSQQYDMMLGDGQPLPPKPEWIKQQMAQQLQQPQMPQVPLSQPTQPISQPVALK